MAPLCLGCGGGSDGSPTTTEVKPPTESTPAQRDAAVIFDDSRVHKVVIKMSDADWASILADSEGDTPRPATFTLDGITVLHVGVRPSGESSRVDGNVKMSIRIDFDAFEDKKKLGGYKSLKVSGAWDDPFVLRDQLAYWYYRHFMPAPREVSTELVINGSSRGVFELEEIWEKQSLKSRFTDDSGTLYRLRGVAGFDPYDYIGDDPALYVPMPWDAKGTHEMAEHAVIPAAMKVLKQDPANVGTVIDMDNMVTYFACSALLSNTDGFGSGFEIDDVFEYHDPTTGKFFMLPWDPDNTFGSLNELPTRDIFEHFDNSATSLLMKGSYRDQYLAKLNQLMVAMPLETLNAEIDREVAQIMPLVQADTLKMYPTEHFIWSVGYVKDFVAARYASIQQQTSAAAAPVGN